MAIDFNTPNPTISPATQTEELASPKQGLGSSSPEKLDPDSNLSGRPNSDPGLVPFGWGTRLSALFYISALILSTASMYLSVRSASRIYAPKPIIVQCDPSVLETIRQISEKMNIIGSEKSGNK